MLGLVGFIIVLLALLSGAFFVAAVWALRRRAPLKTTAHLVFGLLFLSLSALFTTLAVATQGYRALTHEEVAAVVTTEPTGADRFRAHFQFPNGEQAAFELAGDELYVDAHILKWKPIANVMGWHTSYELDRVAGRYSDIMDEKTKGRTVYSLASGKPIDMLALRNLYPVLKPLLDVEYGSATFGSARRPGRFELRVSRTGLLLREVGEKAKGRQ